MKTTTLRPERLFRALSDKTRLRILHLLLDGEVCVCDLVSVLGCPQPTVSRHLAYLRRANLVSVRKDGVWAYYQIQPAATQFEKSLRQCIECCGQLPRLARDLRKLRQKSSSCCE